MISSMFDTVTEPDSQTTTVVGKASVTDDSTPFFLWLLGFSATKPWSTAVWHTKEIWKATGKIFGPECCP